MDNKTLNAFNIFLYCSCISLGVACGFIITRSLLRMLCEANIKALHKSAGVWLAAHQAGKDQAWTSEALASVPQRKQWCQNFWTRCNIIPLWGLRGAKSSAEIWKWRCDHKSEVPHTLSLLTNFSLFSLSPIQSFGLSQPATAHFKPISDRPASCTSAENHKLFYWMKFLQSDELSVTDSRYTASVLCEWKCASCQIFKKK